MKQRLQQRLQELTAEFESGQKVLTELDDKRTNVQNTLLRIQGAIQLLEEELAKENEDETSVSSNELDTEALTANNGA
ncbi:hypothetical protein [Okeania sp. SIO1I7]|uniref:hypothetical protein n=1 Tax=Okeania sp. SIO1I7 TaxID=2607772 RepID=UPI0013FC9D3D|nr:hypothetical protein [Okeania sp. SIO1I7]NET27730.1 hypothetical protein [Okeania sp. SIO1I7]